MTSFESKSSQNNPKKRRTLGYARGLFYLIGGTRELWPKTQILSEAAEKEFYRVLDLQLAGDRSRSVKEALQTFNQQQRQRAADHVRICLAAAIAVLEIKFLYQSQKF